MNIRALATIEGLIILTLLGYIYFAFPQKPLVKVTPHQAITHTICPATPKQRWQKKQQSIAENLGINKPTVPSQVQNKPDSMQAKKQFESLLEKLIKHQGTKDFEELIESHSNELFSLIMTNPDVVDLVLKKYDNVYDPKLESFLAQVLIASETGNLEKTAQQKLLNNSDNESRKWLRLLSYSGATTRESRQTVRQQMQRLNEPESISLAIQSLAPINAYSEERKAIAEELKGYLEHPDEAIQTQALRALIHWNVDEREKLILNAFKSSSAKIRSTAILSAYESGVQSEKIKSHLLNIMKDEKQNSEDRFLAANILDSYQLSDTQRDSVVQFMKNTENFDVNIEELR